MLALAGCREHIRETKPALGRRRRFLLEIRQQHFVRNVSGALLGPLAQDALQRPIKVAIDEVDDVAEGCRVVVSELQPAEHLAGQWVMRLVGGLPRRRPVIRPRRREGRVVDLLILAREQVGVRRKRGAQEEQRREAEANASDGETAAQRRKGNIA
ncbi:MAG TPA: hypothetical protein VF502_10405 [Stellaceae bacterium]